MCVGGYGREEETGDVVVAEGGGGEEGRGVGGTGGYVRTVFEVDGECEVAEDEGCGWGVVVCCL